MLKAKISILLLFLLMTCGCFSSSKTEVSKIGVDEKGNPLTMRNGKAIKMNGVFYALPRTKVKVKVPVKREDQYPGKFADFAKCFLPHKADDAIMTRSTAFSIGTPEFSERGVPDLDEVYMIRVKSGYFEDKSLTLGLTEAGVFTSVEAMSEDRSVDVALGVLDTALDIGTQIAGMNLARNLARAKLSDDSASKAKGITDDGPAKMASKGAKPEENELKPEQLECYKKMEAAYVDEKLMKVKYKKMVEAKLKNEAQKELERRVDNRVKEEVDTSLPQAQQDKLIEQIRIEESDKTRALIREDIKKSWLGEGPFPSDPALISELAGVKQALNIIKDYVRKSYDEAQDSFAQIQAKQDQLDTLIAGSALPNTQVDALKLTIEQIRAEIDTFSARYFLGWKKSDEWIGNFEFDPPNISPNVLPGKDFNPELFTFSAAGGICDLLETQANKVKPNFKVGEKCTADFKNDQIKVALQITRDTKLLAATISNAAPDDRSDRRERGFYYRVPGVALVRLMTKDAANTATEKARKPDVQIAQYGLTASLPASTGGRTTKYVMNLFETSGAMKNFTLGSDALITKSQVEELNSTVNATLEAKAKRKQAEIDAELESKDELKRLKREREILEEKNKIEAEKKKLQGTTP
jgi:hypothetical protein